MIIAIIVSVKYGKYEDCTVVVPHGKRKPGPIQIFFSNVALHLSAYVWLGIAVAIIVIILKECNIIFDDLEWLIRADIWIVISYYSMIVTLFDQYLKWKYQPRPKLSNTVETTLDAETNTDGSNSIDSHIPN